MEHSTDTPSSKMVKRYKVTIGGDSYFLISDEPEDRVKEVARLVDSQLHSMSQLGHSDDPRRLAVLVALQCANKLVACQELMKKYQDHNEKLMDRITQELELLTP